MKGHKKYISNVIYEEPSSQEISNSHLKEKKNSFSSSEHIKKSPFKERQKKNDINFNTIFPIKNEEEETLFLKQGILNNSSYENNEISLSEIDGGFIEGNTTITYNQAYKYFCNIDYSMEKKIIVVEDFKDENCCSKILICGNKLRLNSNLKKERELIFCIAKIIYNENKDIHYYILTTIYSFLTGENICPKKGNHWEKIGFQDEDPMNDLRSVGMFGPLQILFLIENYSNFLLKFYKYLLKFKCEWLFVISLLNLTKITLDNLRNGNLIHVCNRRNQVLNVVNDFYCGLIYQFSTYLDLPKEEKLTAEFISNQIENLKKMGNKIPNYILSKKSSLDDYKN